MEKYLTKKEILDITGISEKSFNKDLKRILSMEEFSSLTKLKKIESSNQDKQEQTEMVINGKILKHFFFERKKPNDITDEKKYRSYIKAIYYDFRGSLETKISKEDNLNIINEINNFFIKTHGKSNFKFIFWLEKNKEDENFNIHFVFSSSRRLNTTELLEDIIGSLLNSGREIIFRVESKQLERELSDYRDRKEIYEYYKEKIKNGNFKIILSEENNFAGFKDKKIDKIINQYYKKVEEIKNLESKLDVFSDKIITHFDNKIKEMDEMVDIFYDEYFR